MNNPDEPVPSSDSDLDRIGRHILLFVALGPLFGLLFLIGAIALIEPESFRRPGALVSNVVFVALPFTYIVGATPSGVAGGLSALLANRPWPIYLSLTAVAGGLASALFSTAVPGPDGLGSEAFLPIFSTGAFAAAACGLVHLRRRRFSGVKESA